MSVLYIFSEKTHRPYFGLSRPTSHQNFNLITFTVLLGGYWNTAQVDTHVRKPLLEAESLALSLLPNPLPTIARVCHISSRSSRQVVKKNGIWFANWKWALDLFFWSTKIICTYDFFFLNTVQTHFTDQKFLKLDVSTGCPLGPVISPLLFNTVHQWPQKWEPQTHQPQWQSHCGWCRLRAATSNSHFPSGAKAKPFWS